MRVAPPRVRHAANRLRQTPRTFANWRPLLLGMAGRRLGHGPDTLTFVTRDGIRIDGPNRPGARVPVYEIFAEDCYRLEWFLGDLLRQPVVVIDVGGHIGTFAVRMATLHPRAVIDSYEPSATTAQFLRRNVEQNDLGQRVRVVEAAVAGNAGRAAFVDNGAGSGLNHLAAVAAPAAATTDVAAVTFDDAVRNAPGHVDVVKLDCEGGEYDLVLNSADDSWAGISRVVIEHHGVPNHSWPELLERFTALGFTLEHYAAGGSPAFGCAWLSRSRLPPVT